MMEKSIGLTSVYNQFHIPDESGTSIRKIRDLHVKLDNSVVFAYGWHDLDLEHGFHETKRGIRFTISEEAQREVLQRLLKLNYERYDEEINQGLHDKKKKKKKTPTPRRKKISPAKKDGNLDLFDFMNGSPKESK